MARLFSLLLALGAVGVHAITPEQMLSAPRRGDPNPNPTGEIAFFSVSQYSFDEGEYTTEWKLLSLDTGEISDLALNSSEVSEIAWLPGTIHNIIYINSTNEETEGGVSLWTADITNPTEVFDHVADLPAPFSGLKVARTKSGNFNILFNCLAYPNGTAYNPELAVTPRSTGRLYADVFVRHWDAWLTPERYSLYGATLEKSSNYSLSDSGMRNFLQELNFTLTRPETPVQPFGDSGDYDISPDGKTVAFLTKAPQLPKQNFTASYIYLVPFEGDDEPVAVNGPGSKAYGEGARGASASPRFSPDGSKLFFFQMDGISYEADKNKMYVVDISDESTASNWRSIATEWDRSPGSVAWAPDSISFFVSAEDIGQLTIYYVPLNASSDYSPPNITEGIYVTSFSVLPDSSVFASTSAIYSSKGYHIVSSEGLKTLFDAYKEDPELAGLGPNDTEVFFFTGALGIPIHSWIVKPTGFSPNKTYPLAMIVHGGPQGSNANAWSTRWNLKTWADQGYVVVAPNPVGSTGFGQFLTDAIQNDWGGAPYQDLVNCWAYVNANLSYVDTEHGIEAGASYGGYMTNWIQGHDLGRKFKALVTHDGVTNTLSNYDSEELWFIQHDNNGTIWNNRANYERWNPMNHILNFSTPHFIVHNSLDYRLPEAGGIEMFNYLQERGIPSRFLSFPDETHWVTNPENSLFWHTEIFNWINHWSGVGGALDNNAIGY